MLPDDAEKRGKKKKGEVNNKEPNQKGSWGIPKKRGHLVGNELLGTRENVVRKT